MTNFFVFGILMYRMSMPQTTQSWYGHFLKPKSILVLTITSSPEQKTKTIKYVARVLAVVDGQQKRLVKGKILVYFLRHKNPCKFRYGDTLLISNQLQPIPGPKNPGEFDYRRYLQRQKIYHQLFVGNMPYVVMPHQGKTFFSFILGLKEAVINRLSKHLNGEEERGIAEALLIGYKENLDLQLTPGFDLHGIDLDG